LETGYKGGGSGNEFVGISFRIDEKEAPLVTPSAPDPALLARIREIVGPRGWLDQAEDIEPHVTEPRGRFRGRTALVVRPASTAELAAVVTLCHQARQPIVPQGGNTGLVGGSIPDDSGTELVLSLGRMTAIRGLDADNFTVTVEAGCTLAAVQAAAEAADRRFPLSFGAEGSCQIGGCLSTNAGGALTLRYGNTRDLVLGLEVVLPDGQVWSGLRTLRKDNTGYDLKHLFIGAEGTLGVITAAVLKLYPRPRRIETMLVALPEPAAAIALLGRARAATGDAITAFELIPRIGLEMALRHVPGIVDPFTESHPWYVLIEAVAGTDTDWVREALEAVLGDGFEAGSVLDAAIAASVGQARAFWRIREGIVEAQKHEGASLKNDISVPVSSVAAFIEKAAAAVAARIPGVRPVPFGHVGDGNVHFNLSQPVGTDGAAYLARWDEIQTLVNDIVLSFNGSISAEHGIGRIKREELARTKPALELALMRRIKAAFDPEGGMNPGTLLP